MKANTVYIVSYSDYDQYSPHYVSGPAVEDFQALCDSLLDEAVEQALIPRKYYDEDEQQEVTHKTWIGWDSIADSMVLVLERHGYTRVTFEQVRYSGSTIIDEREQRNGLSDSSYNKIVAHNQSVRDQLY